MPKRVKVVVVGDAASDVADLLAQEGLDVLQVGEAQATQAVGPGDVIVCDARAPGTALDLCTQLRRSLRISSLAVVSSYEAAEQAMDAGYDDVIVAPYDPCELRLRVRNLLRAAGRSTMRAGALVISPVARQVRRWSEEIELTRLEFELLLHLVENAGRVVGYDELLTHVWGCDYAEGSRETVKSCVKRLRRKIEPDPAQPRYLVTVRGVGYRWDVPPVSVPPQSPTRWPRDNLNRNCPDSAPILSPED